MKISHIEIGVCGLSCRLCPSFHRETESRCPGCKSEFRMGAACPFLNCAVKKKGLEFCGFCEENKTCEKWRKHRETGKKRDSFVSYQKLEDNIAFIDQHGLEAFELQQKVTEKLLREMLAEFNDGRSKSLYCVAATLMAPVELEVALTKARERSKGFALKDKANVMQAVLAEVANENTYLLKLRK